MTAPDKPVLTAAPVIAVASVAAVAQPQEKRAIDPVARAENEYRDIIVKKIEQNKFYPKQLRKMRKEGDVTVEFILNRDGSIQQLRVVEVSGPSALKKAALKAIKVSALFPPFPEQSARQSWAFKTSLQYRLQ